LIDGYAGVPREMGTIHSVKEKYGFIKCYSKQDLVFYHINECDDHIQFEVGDEVDFLLVPDTRPGHDVKATSVRFVRSTSIFGGGANTKILPNAKDMGNFFISSTGSPSTSSSELSLGSNDSTNSPSLQSSSSFDKRDMLEWINNMASKPDGEILLLYINQLQQLLNQDELPFSVIQPLIVLLTSKSIRNSERTDRIFEVVLSSKFLLHPRNLRSYILRISDSIARPKVAISDDIGSDFGRVVDLLCEIIDRCKSVHISDLPLQPLNSTAQKN